MLRAARFAAKLDFSLHAGTRAPLRADRTGQPHIGGLSGDGAAHIGVEPTHGVRDPGGDHRAPANGAIGAGDLLDGAEDDERLKLRPAHGARQVHLQEASLGECLNHRSRHAAQRFAFLTHSEDLGDQASGGGHNLGLCHRQCRRRRDARIHDAARANSSGEPVRHDGMLSALIQSSIAGSQTVRGHEPASGDAAPPSSND